MILRVRKQLDRALLPVILLTLATLLSGQALAQADNRETVAQIDRQLSALEAQLKQLDKPDDAQFKTMLATLKEIRQATQSCVADAADAQGKLEQELKILSPESGDQKTAGDAGKAQEKSSISSDLERQRQPLMEQLGKLDTRRASCQLLLLRSDDLEGRIGDLRQQLLARQLMTREATLLQVIEQNLDAPEKWLDLTSAVLVQSTAVGTVPGLHLLGLVLLGVLATLAGLFIRRKVKPLATRPPGSAELASGFYQALLASIAHYTPVLLFFATISAYLELVLQPQTQRPFFVLLVHGLLLYLLATATIRTFLRPLEPAALYLALPEGVGRVLSRRLQVLALLLLIGKLLQELGDDGLLDKAMLDLARAVWIFVLVLNLVWILWLMQRLDRWRQHWGINLLLSLGFASGLLASWLGYRLLGVFIIFGLIGTIAGLGVTLLVSKLLKDLFDGLDEGRHPWQQNLRRSVGVKEGEYLPGLGWMRLLAGIALWAGFATLGLYIWGLSDQSLPQLQNWFIEGFQVAGFNFVPGRLLFAILVFALLLTLSRWFTARLNNNWLQQTRMERGAREALVTFSRYTIVAGAVLFTLSIAGIQFTNLAIIAGALSVGIGFGLQNVVNNFVSGLILLFERPVRTGDWIVVGSTQGTVKRISIRSTVVQTFERAEVIVPNSELISGQVTNWTLDTPWARLSVPVGVAYGSNTEKVKEILLEVAKNHPLVVLDHAQWPQPTVLFMAFGASSLDFELRVIIKDILNHAQVRSDLNFAIDKAFRENGIEIPFPQQDVHLKHVPDKLRGERTGDLDDKPADH